MRNLSYVNEFDLHLNALVIKTCFHMKGFALGLVLKQRQRQFGIGLFTRALQSNLWLVSLSQKLKLIILTSFHVYRQAADLNHGLGASATQQAVVQSFLRNFDQVMLTFRC